MPVLCFCGQKGGVGKSTLALALAAEWHRRRMRVLVVDADDEQRTALTWADLATEQERDAPPVIALGDNIISALPGLAAPYELVIIDCPGRNGRRVTRALALSDLAILPCSPGGPSVCGLDGSINQVRDVQSGARPELEALILITLKQPNTVIGRRARAALDEGPLGILDTELFAYITYDEAFYAGQGVTTYEPRSEAAAQVRMLANEIERRFGVKRKGKLRAVY